MSVRCVVLALVLTSTACGGTAAHHPSRAIDDYADALRRQQWDRAYDLMSERYRASVKREDFVRMMKGSRDEARATAARLEKSTRRVDVTASVVYDDLGDRLQLVQEGGAWRIDGDPIDFYPQDTPESALRSFIRAVELRQYEVVLRFVPNRYKSEMTVEDLKAQFEGSNSAEESAQMIRELRSHLGQKVERQGDHARMAYSDNKEVQFVLEDGVWKIEDPD